MADFRARPAGSGMPTTFASSMAPRSAAGLVFTPFASGASRRSDVPTVHHRIELVIGSWKIIEWSFCRG